MPALWGGWMPYQPSPVSEMFESQGWSMLMEYLMGKPQREKDEIAELADWFNYQIYSLVLDQEMDLEDAVATVRGQIEGTPGWDEMQERIERYAPHLLAPNGQGGASLVYQVPREILHLHAETEAQAKLLGVAHEYGIDTLRKEYGLKEQGQDRDHAHDAFMAGFLSNLDLKTYRSKARIDEGVERRLKEVDAAIQTAFMEGQTEAVHNARMKLEQFLHENNLEVVAGDRLHEFDVMAEAARISRRESVVSNINQRQILTLQSLLLSRRDAEIHGQTKELKLLDEEIADRREQLDITLFQPMRDDLEVKLAERLTQIEQNMHESLIYTKEDVEERLQKARESHDLALQANDQDHAYGMLGYGNELQRNLIEVQINWQLDADMNLAAFSSQLKLDYDEVRDLVVDARLAVENGNMQALARLNGEIQDKVNASQYTREFQGTVIMEHIAHYRGLEIMDKDTDNKTKLQDRQNAWDASENEKTREAHQAQFDAKMVLHWGEFALQHQATLHSMSQAEKEQAFREYAHENMSAAELENFDIARARLGLDREDLEFKKDVTNRTLADAETVDARANMKFFVDTAWDLLGPQPGAPPTEQEWTAAFRSVLANTPSRGVPTAETYYADLRTVFDQLGGDAIRSKIYLTPEEWESLGYDTTPEVEDETAGRRGLQVGGVDIDILGGEGAPLRQFLSTAGDHAHGTFNAPPGGEMSYPWDRNKTGNFSPDRSHTSIPVATNVLLDSLMRYINPRDEDEDKPRGLHDYLQYHIPAGPGGVQQ